MTVHRTQLQTCIKYVLHTQSQQRGVRFENQWGSPNHVLPQWSANGVPRTLLFREKIGGTLRGTPNFFFVLANAHATKETFSRIHTPHLKWMTCAGLKVQMTKKHFRRSNFFFQCCANECPPGVPRSSKGRRPLCLPR